MNPEQKSISAAFLIVGILIAARHTGWWASVVHWFQAPPGTATIKDTTEASNG